MPSIPYRSLDEHLGRTAAADWPAVILICGEEMLCQKAYAAVIDHLMPQADKAIGIETFDGGEDCLGDVLTCLNTYAMLASAKIVVLHGARLFYSSKAQQGLREKMTQAARSGEMKKASRPFLNLMALIGLGFEDLDSSALRTKVADDVDGLPAPWFEELIAYCREKGLKIPDKQDDAALLGSALKKGFPDGHRLVITTDLVDRRKALFKAIDQTGLVVDCAVPKGESRADRMAQEAVSQTTMDAALATAGKRLAMDARRRLMQWTGFDLRTLAANLEKLISYVGERQTIRESDVTAVLQRTRKDPIFAFTNVVADRDLSASLFYMKNLLDEGMHPLQLLSAVANQIRRLLLAKDFIVRDGGRSWSTGMAFPQFKSTAFKAVLADDEATKATSEAWGEAPNPPAKGKKGKSGPVSDLVLAKNPKSPFPVFQTLKKSDNFTRETLTAAMIDLSVVDLQMKSTGKDPYLLLESFLFHFCRK